MLTSAAAVLLDGFAPIEFGLIAELFAAQRQGAYMPAVKFRVCGVRPVTPRLVVGVEMTPAEIGLSAVDEADLVLVPGGEVFESYPGNVLEALRAASERGARVMSVCTGAFVLGAAGLLDGRRCTTHWDYASDLARRHPRARVENRLFVEDDNIITCAGAASAVDACLHLAREEFGQAAATGMARRILAAPVREGDQRQCVKVPTPTVQRESLQPLREWMLDHLSMDHTVASLARRAQLSERTLHRQFAEETGTTPIHWLTWHRVQRAQLMLEQSDLSVEQIAVECGFRTPDSLRNHFRRVLGVPPNKYRRRLSPHESADPQPGQGR